MHHDDISCDMDSFVSSESTMLTYTEHSRYSNIMSTAMKKARLMPHQIMKQPGTLAGRSHPPAPAATRPNAAHLRDVGVGLRDDADRRQVAEVDALGRGPFWLRAPQVQVHVLRKEWRERRHDLRDRSATLSSSHWSIDVRL